jgi:ribonuclease HII
LSAGGVVPSPVSSSKLSALQDSKKLTPKKAKATVGQTSFRKSLLFVIKKILFKSLKTIKASKTYKYYKSFCTPLVTKPS